MTTATRTTPDLDRAVALFYALSDSTRLSILEMLQDGERCICELEGELDAALRSEGRPGQTGGEIRERVVGEGARLVLVPMRALHDLRP